MSMSRRLIEFSDDLSTFLIFLDATNDFLPAPLC